MDLKKLRELIKQAEQGGNTPTAQELIDTLGCSENITLIIDLMAYSQQVSENWGRGNIGGHDHEDCYYNLCDLANLCGIQASDSTNYEPPSEEEDEDDEE